MKQRMLLYATILIYVGVIFMSFNVKISAQEANYEAGNVAVQSLMLPTW